MIMTGRTRLGRRTLPIVLAVGAVVTSTCLVVPPASAATTVSVSVDGNHLVNADGQTVRLLGVDRSGTEYACEQGWGIFDGPSDAASVAAMAKWHVNAVRLPLNEGCWLDEFTTANDPYDMGRNPAPFEGSAYRTAVGAYVTLLHKYGIAVIVTLTGLDAPDGLDVPPMADSTYSGEFWSSVATTFKSDPGVLFDLYNEPHAISWSCWLNGCPVTTSSGSYQTVGMQALVTTIRAVGATQPIMLGGLDYSSDETSWLTYMPTDPDHSLVVSFHTYNTTNCNTSACWNATVAPLATDVPVVTGEFGEYDCATSYSDAYMKFADGLGISYLGWAWDAISSAPGGWDCAAPALIKNYKGKPSPEGAALHAHLKTLFKHGQLPPVL
jgi:endoglucanase